MKIAKIGDVIEYSFDKRDWDKVSEKTFRVEVQMVDLIDNCYGIYAPYGADLVPFGDAKIITPSPPSNL